MNLKQLMDDAVKAAEHEVVSVVYPHEHRVQLLSPVPRPYSSCGKKYYFLNEPYGMIDAFSVLTTIQPKNPITFPSFRIHYVPDIWQKVLAMDGSELLAWVAFNTDEDSRVLSLQAAMASLQRSPEDHALYVARDVCAAHLAKIEAANLIRRIDRPEQATSRELNAMAYLNLYWTMISGNHVQLTGSPWAELCEQAFQSAKSRVKDAMARVNRQE